MTHPLTRALLARNVTTSRFVRELAVLARERGAYISPGRAEAYRWQGRCKDKPRRPEDHTQRLIGEWLGLPPEAVDPRAWPHWLESDPLQHPPDHPWTPSGALAALTQVSGEETDMDRRSFTLTGGALTGSLLAWLTTDPAAAGQITSARRIGETAVARIEQRVGELRRADDTGGGGQLLDHTATLLRLVTRLLRDRSYTDAHGLRLYAAAADLARQRAAARFDVYDRCDDGLFEVALRAARTAGDDALGANILGFWATAAANTGRPRDAETMATAALATVRGRTTPRVEALLSMRRGRARAHTAHPGCWADFDHAETLLDGADAHGDQDPEWIYWFGPTDVGAARASSHRDRDQPSSAAEQFAHVAHAFPHRYVRDRALYLTRQADAEYAAGQIEEACATADQALTLTQTITSRRTTAPLLELAAKVRTSTFPAARDFHERAQTVLT
ncbi:transcriptional regulator [Streptomyces sp. RFCAC02]|uniref:transcriptional regulator n=1 Tax=Streptomyces sp. RFCAC02 TaxID=2499143 RepID=UPI001F10DFC2|nr:transcriptional regulator [Streptomyces sp. RFCAC02]